MKPVPLVAEPPGVVTLMAPVIAPAGTTATISVDVDDVTFAAVPSKLTVFDVGVAVNPVPWILTVVPIGPFEGEKSMIATSEALCRPIASRLPAASY